VTTKSLLPEAVANYVSTTITRETPVQTRLRAETALLPRSQMQIAADQGALLAMFVRLLQARRIVEIGTFTGYSALTMAAALPEEGVLIACDKSEEWTQIARRYWREAGVAAKISLKLGPALETLAMLLAQGDADSFDLAFIDADKENGAAYYEACLQLIRGGGLIIIDNAIWHGDVANPQIQDAETQAIRALNEKVRDDPRVDACLMSIGDGMMVARKK
jgi:predicted O-methyltransferase YrrM